MSIVGPRPERPEIAAEYEKEMPEFRLRLQARAGLTGYAQVYGKYNTTPYDKRDYPELNLVVLIGSVRNTHRINSIFEKYHPELVYHAAAHKHVPLMESSPNEAIKNNVFGTLNTAKAASENGCRRFILISTDKGYKKQRMKKYSLESLWNLTGKNF